jgi:hypothetical protein
VQGIPVALSLDSDVTGEGIYDFYFTLLYDTAVLSATGVSLVDTLSEGWSVVVNRDVPGQITVVGYSATPLSGQGVFLNVIFDTVGIEGESSALTFSNFEFNDGAVPVSTYGDTLTLTNPNVTVTGTIIYYGPNANPVSNVILNFNSTSPISTTTDATGVYSQALAAVNSYTAVPTKTNSINGAISSLDASTAAQYKAGLISLTADQQRACDVNGDMQCGSHDASSILRYLVNDPELAYPVATWHFDPASRTYTELLGDLNGEDYVAYLLGDVTANWEDSSTLRSTTSDPTIEARINAQQVLPNTTITTPVMMSDLTGSGVFGYDGTLMFDTNVITLEDIVQSDTLSEEWIVATRSDEPGIVRFAAYGFTPMEGQGKLLSFVFQVTEETGLQTSLDLDLRLNEGQPSVQVVDGQLSTGQQTSFIFLPLVIRDR